MVPSPALRSHVGLRLADSVSRSVTGVEAHDDPTNHANHTNHTNNPNHTNHTNDMTQRQARVESCCRAPMTPHRLHTPIALCAPVPASQRSALHPLTSPPASLYPYLSSPEAGWGGLVARAIHMVREMEGWRRRAHGAGWGADARSCRRSRCDGTGALHQSSTYGDGDPRAAGLFPGDVLSLHLSVSAGRSRPCNGHSVMMCSCAPRQVVCRLSTTPYEAASCIHLQVSRPASPLHSHHVRKASIYCPLLA
jgi:hypothetical protein